ncbi:hypothetical protein K5X82_16070 [Halosquirtibacter xylanolyticus]|uniref:chondroitinase family polysaccharide lyase n=1 Tax=Halosquirtibacter xylanolyticus TaxID=3374599 RepID=UPI003748C081|nr:hypothetical protein K5X82_16070 [Prolixibacteraceae bacterium]
MKKILFILALWLTSTVSFGQYIGLEGAVPANWTPSAGTNLTMSSTHFKLGSESVQWSWTAGSKIEIANPANMNKALNTYKGGLMLWIYNETPIDDEIVVEFGNGTKVSYWFNYKINFKGWRACWIRFKQDMKGAKDVNSLAYMRIKAPTAHASGKLYFDRMMFPNTRINDRVTPDAQLPYINPEMNTNHWGAVYYWENLTNSTIPLKGSLTAAEQKELETFTDNIYASLSKSISSGDVTKAKNFYNNINIQRVDGQITGKPYVSNDEADLDKADDDIKMKDINKYLYLLAKAAKTNKDAEALEMYINMMDWAIDQGFAYNSGMGTNHHYGYNFTGFCESILLLQEELTARGVIEKYAQVGTYWSGIQEYKATPHNDEFQGVIDSWNTITTPRLSSIAIKSNTPEKYRNLQEMKRWMDESLKYSNGTIGGIKPDGSSYHHGALYPAYAVGGFSGLGKYINLTRNTPFGLSNDSRIHMWDGMKAMIRYSQKRHWGLGISGRHPLENNGQISNGTVYAMGYLAVAGNPYNGNDVWDEVGAQYMRFESRNTSSRKAIVAAGVSEGTPYQGAYTFNYSAFGVYRRDNWMVSIKGYNKYTWGSEIYETDNRYGRYQSYGTVQVLNGANATNANNGFNENGWDWNRAPGATYVHLPFDELESYKDGDHMAVGSHSQRGEMAFTGYANLENQYGLFGMLLREENNPKFTPSHQADKSVFAFDRYVVCSGTNISNDNATYRTETAIFQNQLSNKALAIVVDGTEITSFPYAQDFSDGNAHWIIDSNGNGYWIKGGQSIEIRKQTQNSKSNNLELDTTGDFAVAVINHGTAPKATSYEYVILPNTTTAEMQAFATKMASTEKSYTIEHSTTNYHVYSAPTQNVKGYCFFKAAPLSDELISQASRACLILTKKINAGQYRISYTDPDLRIVEDGPLTTNPSQYGDGVITLKGSFAFVGTHPNCELVSRDSKTTVIKFSAIHGMKNEVVVERVESPILISESFENVPSVDSYQLSYTYDLSNKDYFNRYELASMNKYYANATKINGTHEAYLLAGANMQDASGNPIEVTFAPVSRPTQIKSLHCSFLLGTLFSPSNKFEDLDFVKLEYKDKDGNYQPIGQLVGSKYIQNGAAIDPNYGKLGTDLDLNGVIDADANTQYSDNTMAKKFNFEIHNIDINTLDFRIQLMSDQNYEGVHLDQVLVYEMKDLIHIANITRTETLLSAQAEAQKSGKLYYIFTENKVENITTTYIQNTTEAVAKEVVDVNGGVGTLISLAKTSDKELYLYMFLEDADGIRSEIKTIASTNTASNDLLQHASINAFKSMGQLQVVGLDFAKSYTISIFNLHGAELHKERINNSEQVFINQLETLPNFFIVKVMEGNSYGTFKIQNK